MSDIDDRLRDMEYELQELKHQNDTHKVKRLASSIQRDLQRMQRKLNNLAVQARKKQNYLKEQDNRAEDMWRRARDDYSYFVDNDMPRITEEIQWFIKDKNEKLSQEASRLRDLWERYYKYVKTYSRDTRGRGFDKLDKGAYSHADTFAFRDILKDIEKHK